MRYFVDQRAGCIAVRDRDRLDPEREGLSPEMPCVVWYRAGFRVPKTCPHCNQIMQGPWQIPFAITQEAQTECDRLNAAQAEAEANS